MKEKRTQNLSKTRKLVEELQAKGWVIVSRNPTILERANGTAEVKPNGIVIYGTKTR